MCACAQVTLYQNLNFWIFNAWEDGTFSLNGDILASCCCCRCWWQAVAATHRIIWTPNLFCSSPSPKEDERTRSNQGRHTSRTLRDGRSQNYPKPARVAAPYSSHPSRISNPLILEKGSPPRPFLSIQYSWGLDKHLRSCTYFEFKWYAAPNRFGAEETTHGNKVK